MSVWVAVSDQDIRTSVIAVIEKLSLPRAVRSDVATIVISDDPTLIGKLLDQDPFRVAIHCTRKPVLGRSPREREATHHHGPCLDTAAHRLSILLGNLQATPCVPE